MRHFLLLLFGVALGGGAALAVLFVLIGMLSP